MRRLVHLVVDMVPVKAAKPGVRLDDRDPLSPDAQSLVGVVLQAGSSKRKMLQSCNTGNSYTSVKWCRVWCGAMVAQVLLHSAKPSWSKCADCLCLNCCSAPEAGRKSGHERSWRIDL